MYTYVHMTLTVNITDFRQNLFKYADLVETAGYEIEVENEGRKVFEASPVKNDSRMRGKRLARAFKNAAGKFKNVDFQTDKLRNARELEYMKKLGQW